MKHIAQFEARLTYGGLNNSARTPLEPIREACVQVATAIFAMRDGPNRQGALLAQAVHGILQDLGVADRPGVASIVRKRLELVAGSGA